MSRRYPEPVFGGPARSYRQEVFFAAIGVGAGMLGCIAALLIGMAILVDIRADHCAASVEVRR